MTYRVSGLDPAQFAHHFKMNDTELARINARRVTAGADHGWPCRISLRDAQQGESLILLHHVSHDVATPFRSAYAIYVREAADSAAVFVNQTPPVFAQRVISLRGFDADGQLIAAELALPGQSDAAIRAMFADTSIAYLHAHNAAPGCFSARIDRA